MNQNVNGFLGHFQTGRWIHGQLLYLQEKRKKASKHDKRIGEVGTCAGKYIHRNLMRLSDRQHTHPALCCSYSILPHHRTIMRCANATKNAEDCLLLQFLLLLLPLLLPPLSRWRVEVEELPLLQSLDLWILIRIGLRWIGSGVPIKLLFSAEY